jgi:hypothetical protein
MRAWHGVGHGVELNRQSRDRRRACLRESQAYPNSSRYVRVRHRAAASGRATARCINLSHAPSRGSAALEIRCQAHNYAIYARIFAAIDMPLCITTQLRCKRLQALKLIDGKTITISVLVD